MSDNIVLLNGLTTLDLPVDRVLKAALEADLSSVVILGYDDENIEYFASSIGSVPEVNYLLDRLKLQLVKEAEQDE